MWGILHSPRSASKFMQLFFCLYCWNHQLYELLIPVRNTCCLSVLEVFMQAVKLMTLRIWIYDICLFIGCRFVCHLTHEGIDEQQMWSSLRGQGVDCNLSYSLYSKQLKWCFWKAFPAIKFDQHINLARSQSFDHWNTILVSSSHKKLGPCGRQTLFNVFHSTLKL